MYNYSGTKWEPFPFPQWLDDLSDNLTAILSEPYSFNSCNVNLYEHGSDSIGWHSDDEALFDTPDESTTILSFSLGETRDFLLRPIGDHSPKKFVRVPLAAGNALLMTGRTQKHYEHAVPKSRGPKGIRINLTFRHISQHSDGCPLHDQS